MRVALYMQYVHCTLHIQHIYFYTHSVYNIYQKLKSLVVWEGRPDFSFLFKSCEIDRRGDLSSNVGNKKSFTSQPSGLVKIMQQH